MARESSLYTKMKSFEAARHVDGERSEGGHVGAGRV